MSLKPAAAHRKDLTSGLSPMQHRHFATIAAIIRQSDLRDHIKAEVARTFADRLGRTNPNFDRWRFLAACGVEEDEEA